MNITLIVAMDNNRGIGFQNTIPWMGKIPADMKYFMEKTTGHPVIMGRNTYLSMGKALRNRTNIALSNSSNFSPNDAHIARSLDEALEIAMVSPGSEEIFVIGGAQVYNTALPYANRLLMTLIDARFETDTYFPEIDMQKWRVESEQLIQEEEEDQFPLRFITYIRKTTLS